LYVTFYGHYCVGVLTLKAYGRKYETASRQSPDRDNSEEQRKPKTQRREERNMRQEYIFS
jgi:hypothetical protein